MPRRIPFMRLSEDISREDEMRNGSFNDARFLWINFFFERYLVEDSMTAFLSARSKLEPAESET